MNSANNLLSNGPVTVVPQQMRSNVSLAGALSQANAAESQYLPQMQFTTANPLFNGTTQQQQQNYQNQVFNMSEAPQLGAAAEQSYLGGNLGTNGSSTFGANYNSNLLASAAQQAFFGGQQYYDDQLNNMLNERNTFSQTGTMPALQADMFNQQQNLQALGLLNNFNLDAAGLYNQQMGSLNNTNVAQQQLGLDASKFNAASRGAMIGQLGSGLGGLAGGSSAMGSGGLGSLGAGLNSLYNNVFGNGGANVMGGSLSSGGGFSSSPLLSSLGAGGFFSGSAPQLSF
jgi:hypothetical protein